MYQISNINSIEYRSFYLIVLLKFFFSANVLNLYINYSSPGGGLLEKLHPSFYVLSLLFIGLLLKRKIFFLTQKEKSSEIIVFLWFLTSLVFLMIYFFLARGSSNLAYLVETFFTACMFIIIVFMLNNEQKTKISNMILFSVLLNSLFAVTEFLFKFHLFSINSPTTSSFRSCAFLGHPLNNALITSFSIFFIFGVDWSHKKKFFYIISYCIAILSYGARAASISVAVGFILIILNYFYSNFKVKRLHLQIFFTLCGIPVLLIVGYQLVYITGMGSRLFANELLDTSGMVRFDLFKVFNYVSFNEFVFGIEVDHFLSVAMKVGVPIIENFWVGFILQFGLLFGLPVLVLMLSMIYFFQKNEAWHIKVACFVFLLTASSNNSLTSKTAALGIFLSLLCASIQKKQVFVRK